MGCLAHCGAVEHHRLAGTRLTFAANIQQWFLPRAGFALGRLLVERCSLVKLCQCTGN
jgi:hypothetical protein